jgi:hypothetical protein
MQVGVLLLVAALVGLGAFAAWQYGQRRTLAREHFIRAYVFPSDVLLELLKAYPQLQLKDAQLAARALRQFFLVHARAGGQLVAMPSKVTDALWHAFILDTRAYRAFCQQAFGSYLHHIPERAMRSGNDRQAAAWRTWRLACLEENVNPLGATRLPLLFALDAKLGIPGAVAYQPSEFKKPESSGGCGGGGTCGGCGDGSGCAGGCGGGD